MIEWDEVEDREAENSMIGGHSDFNGFDAFYPIPATYAQSEAMKALIEFAIQEHSMGGQGWIKGYSMENVSPQRVRPTPWFPVILEWIDGEGDKCRLQVEFFLAQDGHSYMSSYLVCAVVDDEVVLLDRLHSYLCDYHGTPLPTPKRDEGGGELDWA